MTAFSAPGSRGPAAAPQPPADLPHQYAPPLGLRAWAAPDPAAGTAPARTQPVVPSGTGRRDACGGEPADPDPTRAPWGSGLAWLGRSALAEAPELRTGGGLLLDTGPAFDGEVLSGPTPTPDPTAQATGAGLSPDGGGLAPGRGAPSIAGSGRWPVGSGLPDGVGVATWLPDGRWVTATPGDAPEEAAPAPASQRPAPATRQWGRRRVRLARVVARAAGWPRRVAAGMLLTAAVLLALRPDPAGTVPAPAPPAADVVVAARDLSAGTVLGRDDLRTVTMPVAITPAGVSRRPGGLVGRLAAGPIRRGEAVTDVRVVGPGLTAGLRPGESAAVPVRLADPETAALVRAGDRVDILGAPAGPDGSGTAPNRDAVEVASGLRVLAVLRSRDAADGVVLVVAAGRSAARRLAGAATRHRLTVSVRSP